MTGIEIEWVDMTATGASAPERVSVDGLGEGGSPEQAACCVVKAAFEGRARWHPLVGRRGIGIAILTPEGLAGEFLVTTLCPASRNADGTFDGGGRPLRVHCSARRTGPAPQKPNDGPGASGSG